VRPRFLLDTHVVVRWLTLPKKLSSDQARVLREAERSRETVAVSAFSLIEIAMLAQSAGKITGRADQLLSALEANPMFEILPITVPIALDAGALMMLRDSADRAIVATARVHGLRLLTSDERIIESGLVAVVD
jgi:PIN domain nuclease of toxin-antitoxin system